MAEPKELPTRKQVFELDRNAWNVPEPRVAAVAPVHEVWPVRDQAQRDAARTEEGPAAA